MDEYGLDEHKDADADKEEEEEEAQGLKKHSKVEGALEGGPGMGDAAATCSQGTDVAARDAATVKLLELAGQGLAGTDASPQALRLAAVLKALSRPRLDRWCWVYAFGPRENSEQEQEQEQDDDDDDGGEDGVDEMERRSRIRQQKPLPSWNELAFRSNQDFWGCVDERDEAFLLYHGAPTPPFVSSVKEQGQVHDPPSRARPELVTVSPRGVIVPEEIRTSSFGPFSSAY